MPTLSLNMICRDEAPRIARALECAAKVCDELVVVDTGSTDGTQEIVRSFGARLIEIPWPDSFAEARNVALDATEGDWILVLDADDEISDDDIEKLRAMTPKLIESGERFDGVLASYEYNWRTEPDGTRTCTETGILQRLIRRSSGRRWKRRVHEFFDLSADRVLVVPQLKIQHRGVGKERPETGMTRRLLEMMVAEGDTSARTAWYLAKEQQAAGEHDAAIRAFLAVADLPDATTFERYDSFASIWHIATARGMEAVAFESTERMAAIDPDRPDAYIMRGIQALDELGAPVAALELFRFARTLTPPTDGLVNVALYTTTLDDYTARAEAALAEAALSETTPTPTP